MGKYESYLKHRIKPDSIRSYGSDLKRAAKILGMDSETFLKIDSPRKLDKLFKRLLLHREFKSAPLKSRGNIKTAFRTYIKSVERLNDLKPEAERYLFELTQSNQELKKSNKNPIKSAKSIVSDLQSLFEPNQILGNWNKRMQDYLKIKKPQDIDLIYEVSQNLLSGQYYEMVFKHFKATAKVIAIKTHIRVLKARNYR